MQVRCKYDANPMQVFTCCGQDHEEKGHDGHTTHVLYWNLQAPVWNEGENEVMIMERGSSVTSYLKNSRSKEN